MTQLSALPQPLDLALYAGDGFAMLLTFVDQATGDPYPVDGVWLAQIRDKPGGAVLTTWTIDTTEADTGRVWLSLTGAQIESLPRPAASAWDVEQTVDGTPRTWYRGSVKVTSDVTRVAP